jgi:tRNA (guanine9-N1)-methyltransferase
MSGQPGTSQAASSSEAASVVQISHPTDSATAPECLPLSKKAAKRAAKEQRYAVQKLERRAREKEAKKEKKRLKAEKRAAGELDEDDDEQGRRQKRRKLDFGARVVVDLAFDSLMSTKVRPLRFLGVAEWVDRMHPTFFFPGNKISYLPAGVHLRF